MFILLSPPLIFLQLACFTLLALVCMSWSPMFSEKALLLSTFDFPPYFLLSPWVGTSAFLASATISIMMTCNYTFLASAFFRSSTPVFPTAYEIQLKSPILKLTHTISSYPQIHICFSLDGPTLSRHLHMLYQCCI